MLAVILIWGGLAAWLLNLNRVEIEPGSISTRFRDLGLLITLVTNLLLFSAVLIWSKGIFISAR